MFIHGKVRLSNVSHLGLSHGVRWAQADQPKVNGSSVYLARARPKKLVIWRFWLVHCASLTETLQEFQVGTTTTTTTICCYSSAGDLDFGQSIMFAMHFTSARSGSCYFWNLCLRFSKESPFLFYFELVNWSRKDPPPTTTTTKLLKCYPYLKGRSLPPLQQVTQLTTRSSSLRDRKSERQWNLPFDLSFLNENTFL